MLRQKKQKTCSKVWTLFVLLPLIFHVVGCAPVQTGKMALRFDDPPKTNRANSIVLFSLRMENQLKPSYRPSAEFVNLSSENPDYSCNFDLDDPISDSEAIYNFYLVSAHVPPGSYAIGEVSGGAYAVFIRGNFKFPIGAQIEVPPESIVYCGHVDMTNREHKDGEKRSGKLTPLIDQAVTGFHSGTFEVVITDKSEHEIQIFQNNFPWLRNKEIKTIIMKKI